MAKKKDTVKENVESTLVAETVEVANDETVVSAETIEEAEKEITSPDNIENIEKELKEEHKEEVEAQEEAISNVKEEADEIGLEELAEVVETYGDAEKRLNDITSKTDLKEWGDALSKELSDINSLEEKLTKKVETLENGMSPEHNKMVDAALNSRMTALWNGHKNI